MPRGWEWLFWAGAVFVAVMIVATADGSLEDRLPEIAFAAGALVIVIGAWVWKARESRAEEARPKGPIYKSWWVPRSFKMRALSVVALLLIALLIASQTGSLPQALLAVAAFLGLMAVSAWTGSSGNYIELREDGMDVHKVGGAGHMTVEASNLIPYSDIDSIRVKKGSDFDVQFLARGKRDKQKKISFKIVPERRRDFLDELRSRVEATRSEGVSLRMDREL